MVLKAEKLSLTLPGRESPVFRDMNIELGECEIGLVTGSAGSGKTMLGLTVCGFLPLWVGSWNLDGNIDMMGKRLKQGDNPGKMGIILENPYTQLSGMKRSVRQELAFPLECLGIESGKMPARIERSAVELGIAHLLDRNVRSLSGGELQRVLIAGTLISQPRFLFLDRPLTEIDQEFRPSIMHILHNHVKEVNGAALVSEDSWLLPDTHFHKEFSLDKEEKSIPALREVLPESPRGKSSIHEEELLIVDSLSFAYDDINPVINDLSFSLGSGKITFITGPNGSGKSTLAKLITGILNPSSGHIVINGVRGEEMDEGERMAIVGCALQNPALHLCSRTVREEFELSAKWGNPVGELMEILGLEGLLNNHPLELTQAEKKRLVLALASGGRRRILILDEPSQYQDQEGFNRIAKAVGMCASEGKGVLVITHDPRFFYAFPDAEFIRLSQEDSS